MDLEPQVIFLLIILSIWEFYWKGRGLWTAAKKNNRNWFIAILIINSAGLLPLYYLYLYKKRVEK